MRVEISEAGVKLFNLVAHTVAIRIAQPENVGRLRDDDAILVKNEGGDAFEPAGNAMFEISKDMLLVHAPVAIGIFEPGNAILGWAILLLLGAV